MRHARFFGNSGALLAGVAVLALGAGSACAQSADDPDQDIVVTAQKREQSAQDVGIALSVFSGDALARRNVVSAPDIARLTPGVSVAGSFAGQNVTFSIRGVTQQDFQAQAESPVAVYVDEGYIGANNMAGVGLLDIDRVEVLKGPQGTLFGRNATGGLVSITTRKPTDILTARALLSYGSYDDRKMEAAIGGPLGENIQARVAAMYQTNDGWMKNISPTGGDLGGKEMISVRAHLAMQPTDAVDVLATGYYSRINQSWGPYTALSTRSTLNGTIPDAVIVNAPIPFNGENLPPSDFKKFIVNANTAQSRGGYNEIAGGTFKADADVGGATLTSITDYKVTNYKLLLDDDASSISFLDTHTSARVKNLTQEVRLFQDFDVGSLTAGLYYLNINSAAVDLQRLFGLGGVQVSSPFQLKTDSYSAFVQGDVEVAPQVKLSGGFRATKEKKDYVYRAFVQQLSGAPIIDGRVYADTSSAWLYSWKTQAEWRPRRGVLVYLGYSRGTKAGSYNAPFAGGPVPVDADIRYKPEKLDDYELGVKSTLLGGMATLNGSVYYYDYKDYQAFKFVNFATVVTNNKATIKGAELDFNLRPAHGLELMAGISYIDASVKDVPVSNALGAATLARRPPYQSRWQFVGSTRYAFPLGGGEASLQGDVQYRDSFYISLTNFSATKVKGYALLNGRIAWTTADDRWEVAAFGKNLTDKHYRTVGFEASDFGGFTQVGYGEPRWLGLSVGYRI